MTKPRLLILGKVPPPFIGPAVATKIILDSGLKDRFQLVHFDTKLNAHVRDMGRMKWSKFGDINAMYRRFKKALKQEKPDLVLIPIGQTTAGFFKDIPLINSAVKSGAKVILHLRGSAFRNWYEGLDPIRKMAVKRTLASTHGVIVLGDGLRGLFRGLYSESAIHVVPNGGNYAFPTRKNPNLRITYLANYLPGKGLAELLSAIRMLNDKALPKFEFAAYGQWDDEAYRQKCLKTAAEIDAHCTLHPSVTGSEKWQALADTDVFVFAPAAPEGHPWSIVEALAAGLPIVATNRGAIAQNVVDGRNGFLLEDPDPEQLAERLEILLKNEDLRRRMGAESLDLYRSGFTEEAMVGHLEDALTKTLQSACVE